MMGLTFFLLLPVLILFFVSYAHYRFRLPEKKLEVWSDRTGVLVRHGKDFSARIKWEQLQAVFVVSGASGKLLCLQTDSEQEVYCPVSLLQDSFVLWLDQLPGFELSRLAQAIESPKVRQLCWERRAQRDYRVRSSLGALAGRSTSQPLAAKV